jgi:hypothetical protein
MKQSLNGITKEFAVLSVDKVTASEYKEGIYQAQIRQTVTTTYPSKRVDNSMQDSLFAIEDFKLELGESYESTRVGWINVPEGTTAEQVAQLLGTKANARICKKYSNKLLDVLTDEQKYSISAGQRTAAQFAESLVIRNSEGAIVQPVQYSQGFYVNDFSNHKGSSETGINIFGDIDIRVAKTVTVATKAEEAIKSAQVMSKLQAEVDALA